MAAAVDVLATLNRHQSLIRLVVTLCSLLPLVCYALAWQNNSLGINPYARAMKGTGMWSMVMLTCSLSVTPLRTLACFCCAKARFVKGKRLSDWSFFFRLRKVWGNLALIYAGVHAWVYFHMEVLWDFNELWFDLRSRTFLAFGLAALFGLVPLAITSVGRVQKRLGKYWQRLHRLVYGIWLCASLHILLGVKLLTLEYSLLLAAGLILLGLRLLRPRRQVAFSRRRSDKLVN